MSKMPSKVILAEGDKLEIEYSGISCLIEVIGGELHLLPRDKKGKRRDVRTCDSDYNGLFILND